MPLFLQNLKQYMAGTSQVVHVLILTQFGVTHEAAMNI